MFQEWTETFGQTSGSDDSLEEQISDADSTPTEILAQTHKRINLELASDILDKLKENSPDYFEFFVIELLQKNGLW